MKDVPADTPFIFFHWFICVSPLQDFVGGHGTLICSAGHDRPSRARSAPSSMPNDLKYKAIVAESCRGVQVENASSPREPAYPFIRSDIICFTTADGTKYGYNLTVKDGSDLQEEKPTEIKLESIAVNRTAEDTATIYIKSNVAGTY